MEKGRTAGSYFLFLIREGLFRLRRELWGWRGLAAAFIAFYLVVDLFGATESERSTMGQGIAVIWMVLLFPPRMGKLLYLLPFSKRERSHYLLMYLFTYLVFQVFVYLLIGGVACLISGYSYSEWLKIFVFSTVPFLVMYSGVMTCAVAVQKEPKEAYSWLTPFYRMEEQTEFGSFSGECKEGKTRKELQKKRRSELTEEEWSIRKKELRLNIITIVSVVVIGVQVYVCPVFFMREWLETWVFWIGAVLAYVCATAVIWVYGERAWEHINKNGSSGKEDGVCNL